MDDISPGDLKTILHSKRANIYYLQHCRVLVNGGRVEYVTDAGKQSLYWNIPIANTTTILFGTGTSVTQAAMRELAKAGVLVGFCGGGAHRHRPATAAVPFGYPAARRPGAAASRRRRGLPTDPHRPRPAPLPAALCAGGTQPQPAHCRQRTGGPAHQPLVETDYFKALDELAQELDMPLEY